MSCSPPIYCFVISRCFIKQFSSNTFLWELEANQIHTKLNHLTSNTQGTDQPCQALRTMSKLTIDWKVVLQDQKNASSI